MTKIRINSQTNSSLIELFQQVISTHKDQSIIFIDKNGEVIVTTYADLSATAERILGSLRNLRVLPRTKIILSISRQRDLLASFWGCILGGFIPLIMESALGDQKIEQTVIKLRQVGELLGDSLIIADNNLDASFLVLQIQDLISHQPEQCYYLGKPDEVTFLTLTSGSTGTPKCIQLTHGNIISRARGTNIFNEHDTTDVILNWLPFDHIGSISDWHIRPFLLGCQLIYVQKEYILANPLRWLSLISNYRVTHSWSPNFIYNLINHELSGNRADLGDLSCVKFLLSAGENINAVNIQLFIKILKKYNLKDTAVRPAFGMAELGSGITYYQPSEGLALNFYYVDKSSLKGKVKYTDGEQLETVIFTDLGRPIPGVELRIVDDKGGILPGETVGNLEVKGEVVFPGYYNNSLANQEVFTDDGWLRTGDLGFLVEGSLIITGRAKDTIIVNGVNYYCQEIETVVEEVVGVEPSYTAAFAVSLAQEEKIAIVFNSSLNTETEIMDLITNIRRVLITKLGLVADYLIPVDKDVIPKSEIGKIQRKLLREKFESGFFEGIMRRLEAEKKPINSDNLQVIITQVWQNVLGLNEVDLRDSFFALGGNSLLLVQLQSALEKELSVKIPVSVLFQYPTIASQIRYFQTKNNSSVISQPAQIKTQNNSRGAIAVIGMSCRFPGAANIQQFWQNLVNGVESISFFTDEEILASGVAPDLLNNSHYVKARPILQDIELFDAEFFGYTPKEAELLDPQQRLLLEAAWESLEDAGYNPLIYDGRIGIFAGAVMNTYLFNNVYPHRHQLDLNDSLNVLTLDSLGGFQLMVSNDKDYLTTRVSYKLNLTGPSVNVQTACSTSLVAVHLAKQSLLNGECDLALAGGVSLQVPQKVGYLYQEGMIVSPDGHCRAFDQSARGTVFGNGAGLVVLKRLEEAIADQDQIYAVIKGSAINNDGGQKIGYLAPNGEGQGRVIAEAIANANIPPETIGYIETHGTGTLLGDPIEISGLTQGLSLTHGQACPIGSVKTNIGHLQIASGIAGFIKGVLCLHHQKIPPTLHHQQPSAQIDWENIPFYVNTKLQDWSSSPHPRRLGVNSLGVGGTNCHVILEETPSQEIQNPDQRPLHLLTLSARTPQALEELVESYQDFLSINPQIRLADLCFTANTGRVHFKHKIAIIAESVAQLQEKLQKTPRETQKSPQKPPITFLFSGQGSQYSNMSQQLYQTQPLFRQILDYCDQITRPYLSSSILKIIFNHNETQLEQTLNSQVAIFIVEYGLYQLWKSWGIEPTTLIGHSLGEYVAACVAGVFSLEDALKLVIQRAKLIEKLPQGEMRAIFTSLETVQLIIKPFADTSIAAINGEQNIVIAGSQNSLKQIKKELKQQGIKSKKIKANHAFHSPIMQKIIPDFRRITEEVSYSLPTINIISSLTGKIVTTEIANPDYWCEHLYQTVQFTKTITTLKAQGKQIFLECSSQPVLLAMIKLLWDHDQSLFLPTLRPKYTDWEQILASIAQLYLADFEINWHNLDRPYLTEKISLPTYPFQKQKYWLEPTKTVTKINNFPPTPNSKHPFLGQKILSPLQAIIFEAEINSEKLTYLFEHQVNQKVVLPGAAYIEIVSEAIKEIGKIAPINLRDIVIQKPLILTKKSYQYLQVIIDPEQQSWEIYSLSDHDHWDLHCSGKMTENLNKNREKPNLADLKSKLSKYSLSVNNHYDNCQQRGLNYGVTFQGIKELWGQTGTALAKIELPTILTDTINNYQIHPVLLDNCFQVIFAALPETNQTYLPFGIEQITIYGRSPIMWSYAEIDLKNETIPDTFKANLFIFNSEGELMIEVKGLLSKRSSFFVNGWHNWLYETRWLNKPHQEVKQFREVGSWLIINNTNNWGDQLSNFLTSQQQKCYLISTNDHFSQVLEQIPSPLVGVVYLLNNLASEDHLPEDWERILSLIQNLVTTEMTPPPRLWLVTSAAQAVELDNCHRSYSQLLQSCLLSLSRVINLEYPELRCTYLDLESNSQGEELWQAILATDEETQVVYRRGLRFVPRLTRSDLPNFSSQTLRLDIAERGILESLTWQELKTSSSTSNQVTIKVHTVGLNFRDLLNVLGLYPGDAGLLGLECSGEIVAKGDQVTNFELGDYVIAVTSGCLGNLLTVDANLVIAKPEDLDFESAVTMPGAFLTAYYTLVSLAKLQPGEKVLIHSGAGGVGLAAMAIAQKIGAEIFTTASPSKWNFLQSLGIRYIYNSRTLDFAQQIITETNHEGIDVILNCFSGEFIPSSLSVLKSNGRFLEIGKQNIWDEKQIKQVKPLAQYFIVDLMETIKEKPSFVQKILPHLLKEYEPLPKQVFPARQVIDAFRYMQQAQHIGKIVITFPQFKIHSHATYLITGGLGGLGLEVADWLAQKGVQHLALISRHPLTDSPEIARLQEVIPNLMIFQADVGDRPQLASIISTIEKTSPPLKGIIHAAGLLKDNLIPQQTWTDFQQVCRPKIQGAWNLHQLTLNHELEFFVMFSSISSLLGSAGQANYAVANGFLDTLAHLRQTMNLPVLTINWGAWSEIGLAAQLESELQIKGIDSIEPQQGITLLENLLNSHTSQITVANINWKKYLSSHPKTSFLENLSQTPSQPPSQEQLFNLSSENLTEKLLEIVTNQVTQVLGFPESQIIDSQQGFAELGIDSLNSVELRNRLQNILNLDLPSTIAFDYPTISSLTSYLTQQLTSNDNLPKTNQQKLANTHSQIEELSDQEAEALLLAELKKLEQ